MVDKISSLLYTTPNVVYGMIGIYALILFATVVVYAIGILKPEKDLSEVKQRTKTWYYIIFGFSFITLGAGEKSVAIPLICLAFLSFLALKEYFSLIMIRRADRRVLFWAYLSIPIQYYVINTNWYELFIIIIPVYFFLFLPFRMIMIGETKNYLTSMSTIQWGLMTTVFSLGHLGYLMMLDPAQNPAGSRAGLVIFVIFLTQLNDVAQFCWGKALGKRKIVPKVSPNKTWAGFIGGVVTTSLVSMLIAPYLTPITGWHSLTVGMVIAIGGFIGDVSVSALKRDLGVKDSGNLLPGHGGILDRLDSLSYTAPIFFHYVAYFFYE